MECKVCGRHTQNEDANFCENCGNSFRDNYQDNDYQMNNANNQQTSYQGGTYYSDKTQAVDKEDETVSFKDWLLTLALPVLLLFIPIPFLGPIAYIVILFVWAFSSNTKTSKKNWARANLIVSGVLFILFILFTVFIFSAMMNGSFPIKGLEGFENFKDFGGMDQFY